MRIVGHCKEGIEKKIEKEIEKRIEKRKLFDIAKREQCEYEG